MTEQHSTDLIKAIVLLADQLQFIANSLERIEAQLFSISTHVEDAGVNISDSIDSHD
jgi:hypothetical protein